MANRLSDLSGGFDRRSLRERVLLVVALVVLSYFVLDQWLVQPEMARRQQLEKDLAAQVSERQQTEGEIAQLGTLLAREAQASAAARAAADAEAGAAAGANAGRALSIPAAPRLAELIRAIVADSPGLKIVSLRSLPSRPLPMAPKEAAAGAKAATEAPPPIHLHGLDITFSGDYLNLLSCLERLQSHAEPLLWGDLQFSVVKHPDATLRVTVFTLSEQPSAPLGR